MTPLLDQCPFDTRDGHRIPRSPNTVAIQGETLDSAELPRQLNDVAVKYHPSRIEIRLLTRLAAGHSPYSTAYVVLAEVGV